MKREYFLSFIAFFILTCNIFSQNLADTDNPGILPDKKEIGLFLGLGPNIQNGSFLTDCNCKFENGRGLGFTFGGLYEQHLNTNFQWGAMLQFDNRSIEATYRENEVFQVSSTSTGRTESVPILFRNTAFADFYNVSLVPYIKYTPSKYLFFRLGFEAGLNVYSNVEQTKELLQQTARLSNGEIVNVRYSDTKETLKTIQNSEFPEMSKFLMSINPSIGANIPIKKTMTLSPVLMYSYPLNIYSSRGENFNVSALRILIEFRIHMNYRSSE